MQGQLRKEKVSCLVETLCAHCNQPMHIEIDSDLQYAVKEAGVEPLIFVPMVDFERLKDPSIIDAF